MPEPQPEWSLVAFLLLAIVLLPSSVVVAWMCRDLFGVSHNTAAIVGAMFLTVFYRNLTRGMQPRETPTEGPHANE